MTPTPQQLLDVIDALEAKLAEGTPGPWYAECGIEPPDGYDVWFLCSQTEHDSTGTPDADIMGYGGGMSKRDVQLTAAAMNALPQMLAAARKILLTFSTCTVQDRGAIPLCLSTVAAMLEPFARQFGVWGE